MLRMYSRATSSFVTNFVYFASCAAILSAIDLIFSGSSSIVGLKLVFYALLSLHCHRLLLRGGKVPITALFQKAPSGPLEGPIKPFMLKLVAYWAIWAAIWAACIFILFRTSPGNGSEYFIGLILLAAIPTALICYVFLGLFGTALPAAAALQDASYSTALKTGRRSFWRTFFRLVTGSGLSFIAAAFIVALLDQALGQFSATAANLVTEIVGELLGMFGVLLAATALCLAYEDGFPAVADGARPA